MKAAMKNSSGMGLYPIHKIALAWPEMTGEDYLDFVDDVRRNGIHVPAVIYRGELLDGRTRMKAAAETGRTLPTTEWDGRGSMAEYVASLNLLRRHQDPESLDLVAARLEPFFAEEAAAREKAGTLASSEARGRSAQKAADATGTSRAGVNRAKKVLATGTPELVEALEKGKVKTATAARLADLTPEEQIAAINDESKKIRARAAADEGEGLDGKITSTINRLERLLCRRAKLRGRSQATVATAVAMVRGIAAEMAD